MFFSSLGSVEMENYRVAASLGLDVASGESVRGFVRVMMGDDDFIIE